MGLTLGPPPTQHHIQHTHPWLSTAPVAPSIWENPAIGVLRVIPINPAVPGCEVLAPASSVVEQRIGPGSGTGFPEPSVTKDEGPGTPGSGSPVSTSARLRDLNSMLKGVRTMSAMYHESSVLIRKGNRLKLVSFVN